MKIAVLADIHGNHYALNEVLKEAQRNGVDYLLVLGDIVGYYYHPDKVLELLSAWPFHLIKGNHEEILFSLINDSSLLNEIVTKYGNGHKIAIQKLSPDDIEMLQKLPQQKELKFNDVSILMTHGSPWQNNLYVYPDTTKEVLEKFNKYEFDFILFGHTHYSSCFKTQYGLALNPGSVGQSRERGGTASWIIVNTKNKSVQFKITNYDTLKLKTEIIKYDPFNKYNLSILDR